MSNLSTFIFAVVSVDETKSAKCYCCGTDIKIKLPLTTVEIISDENGMSVHPVCSICFSDYEPELNKFLTENNYG